MDKMCSRTLEVRPIRRTLPEYQDVVWLMDNAFPSYEKVPVWLLRFAALRRDIDFTAYYDGEAFVGLSFVGRTEKMAFLLFLAVNPKIRSKGYGSRILEMIKETNTDRDVALNMEVVDETADNYEQRLSRLHFYQRNGFHETGYILDDDECPFCILNLHSEFNVRECERVCRKIMFGIVSPELKKCK